MIEEPPLLTIRSAGPRPTATQVAAFRDIPTSLVCDALGGGGALSAVIRPLGDGRDLDRIVAGPAITADNGPADVLATLAALSYVQPGDVLVAAVAGHQGCAAAGDRVMGMLRNAGGAALVTDGPVRDYAGIVKAGIPVWCTGLTPASPYSKGPGRVGEPVNVGGQQVATGDMIVADRDGVVVVPFERVDAVIARLADVHRQEQELDARVSDGLREFDSVREMLATGQAVVID